MKIIHAERLFTRCPTEKQISAPSLPEFAPLDLFSPTTADRNLAE
jgi:hypothetical protein